MNPILRNFHENENEREAVKAFMIQVLRDITVEKAFRGEDVHGVEYAYELVGKMFDRLDQEYAKISEPIISNSR